MIDNAEIRVILPEGATNIQVKTPFATQRLADDVCVIASVGFNPNLSTDPHHLP